MILLVVFAIGLGWFPTCGMFTLGATLRHRSSTSSLDFLSPPRPAADDGRHRAHRPVLDPHALVGHRDPAARTTSRRPGPRASRVATSCAPTPCRTPCCRRSRSSRSTSASSSPARSRSRSCSTGRVSGRSPSEAARGPRLPGPPGDLPAPGRLGRRRQPRRRPRLRPARPAGPGVTRPTRQPARPSRRSGCERLRLRLRSARSSAPLRAPAGRRDRGRRPRLLHGPGDRPAALRRAAPDRHDGHRAAARAAVSRATCWAPTSSAGTSST